MKRISVVLVSALLMTIVNSLPLRAKDEHVKSVTAITEVFGDGQKVSAVAGRIRCRHRQLGALLFELRR